MLFVTYFLSERGKGTLAADLGENEVGGNKEQKKKKAGIHKMNVKICAYISTYSRCQLTEQAVASQLI